jgi:hypothetical protein
MTMSPFAGKPVPKAMTAAPGLRPKRQEKALARRMALVLIGLVPSYPGTNT